MFFMQPLKISGIPELFMACVPLEHEGLVPKLHLEARKTNKASLFATSAESWQACAACWPPALAPSHLTTVEK
jgi:hypothetical protein